MYTFNTDWKKVYVKMRRSVPLTLRMHDGIDHCGNPAGNVAYCSGKVTIREIPIWDNCCCAVRFGEWIKFALHECSIVLWICGLTWIKIFWYVYLRCRWLVGIINVSWVQTADYICDVCWEILLSSRWAFGGSSQTATAWCMLLPTPIESVCLSACPEHNL